MKKIMIILLLLSISFKVIASWKSTGATEAEFLKITSSARSVALGGGYTALDDFNNQSINPAFLALGKKICFSVNTVLFFQDVYYLNFNASYKLKYGGIGLVFTTLGSGDIPVNSILGLSSVNKRDFSIGVSYGIQLGSFFKPKILKNLYIGINYQYYNESYKGLLSKNGSILGFGVLWPPNVKGLTIGLSFLNIKCIGTKGIRTPFTFKVGAKYDFSFKKFNLNKKLDDFSVIFDFEKTKAISPVFMIGLEMRIKDIVSLRLGNKFFHDTGCFSGGMGLQFFGVQFDYSMSIYRDLGLSHQLSLSYNIDIKERGPKIKPRVIADTNSTKITPDPACFSLIGKKEVIFNLKVDSEKTANRWEFTVEKKNVIYSKEGTGNPPERLIWDGTDSMSNYPEIGTYEIKLSLIETNTKKTFYNTAEFIVVDKFPSVSISADKEIFSPDDDQVDDTITFLPKFSASCDIADWKITISDQRDVILHEIKGSSSLPKNIVWDGRDVQGQVIPQFSIYKYSIKIEDICGYTNSFACQKPVKTDLYINKAADGSLMINLQGVEFDVGKFTIRTNSYPILNQAVSVLQRKSIKMRKVRIGGHTDNVGSLESNMVLSENRSKEVMIFMINKGIDKSRLSNKGFGPTVPVAPNNTQAGRQKNRRVELIIEKE